MVVKQYTPGGEYQQIFNTLIGELAKITIFCGNEKRLRFFYDSEKLQMFQTDTYDLNPEILRHHLKALRKSKGTVKKFQEMDKWHQISPNLHLHKWYGHTGTRRLYVINFTLRSGVGGYHKLH